MVYVLTCAISSRQIKTRPAVKSANSELNRASAVKSANFDAAAEKKIYEGNWSSTYIEKGKAFKMKEGERRRKTIFIGLCPKLWVSVGQ